MNPTPLFWGDTHLGHRWMAERRGFPTVEAHDEAIVTGWNERTGPRDTIYVLGDWSFHNLERAREYFKRLNGRKHLIRGNHDRPGYEDFGWASVTDLRKISVDGQSLVLCHYPMLTWQNAHYGTWHLHGHTHGNLRAPESTRLDVGVDTRPDGLLLPWTWSEVREVLSQRTYDYIDHHTPEGT